MRLRVVIMAGVLAGIAVVLGMGSSVQPASGGSSSAEVYPAHQGPATVPLSLPAIPTGSATTRASVPAQPPTQPPATAVPPARQRPATVRPAPATTVQPPAVGDWRATFSQWAAKLPGQWVIMDKGSWGATALETGTVYIAPRTPLRYLVAVMKHESMHVRQGRIYGGYYAAQSGLAAFGGMEVNADCGALILGANWINYIHSCTAAQRQAAQAILNGVKP